jgi:hypothetical protein
MIAGQELEVKSKQTALQLQHSLESRGLKCPHSSEVAFRELIIIYEARKPMTLP